MYYPINNKLSTYLKCSIISKLERLLGLRIDASLLMFVIAEIKKRDSNTEAILLAIKKIYNKEKAGEIIKQHIEKVIKRFGNKKKALEEKIIQTLYNKNAYHSDDVNEYNKKI